MPECLGMQLNTGGDSHGVGIALVYCVENRRWFGLVAEDREARGRLEGDVLVSSRHVGGNWKISGMFCFDQGGSKMRHSTWTAYEHEPGHALSGLAGDVQMLS